MPGFELIGEEERLEIEDIFKRSNGVMFRYGMDKLRNGVFKVNEFEHAFSKRMNVKNSLLVSSGTAALKVALRALRIEPGDEVITQAFTFVATVEAIVEAGAIPVIVDINAGLNMDADHLSRAITKKTKAIIVVHMLGVPAELDKILAVSKSHGIPLIEDTAWGCGGSFQGTQLGTLGDIGTFSFDYAKAITTGEGGMVVTNNDNLDFHARAYHDHGHENNPSLPRWEDSRHSSGFNYRASELQGAMGLAQLRKLDFILEGQRSLANAFLEVIDSIPGIERRPIPDNSSPTYDAVVFRTSSKDMALKYRASLLECGIGTKILPEAYTWHFAQTWTHIKELKIGLGGAKLDSSLKISHEILSTCVALPISLKPAHDITNRLADALSAV